jgi:uncharacterized metal-binding protein
MEKKTCSCNENAVKTVFSCSGAADLGEISDLVARKLHKDQIRQMKCLAFVSAGITEMIDSVKDSNMLVIDGCPLDCGRLTMEKNGLTNFCHMRLTDMGYEKGKTPASREVVNKITEEATMIC